MDHDVSACADEDEARVGLTCQRKGVFSRVTGAFSLSGPQATSSNSAEDSLGDQWLEFLIQQADAADAAETAAASDRSPLTLSDPPTNRKSLMLDASPQRPLHDWSSTQISRQ